MARTLQRMRVDRRGSTGSHPAPREDHPWQMYVADHKERTNSSEFRAAKAAAKKILATLQPDAMPYGTGPWEMHHGGSLWVLTGSGWRMYRARVAIEWCVQFCADPAKVDRLRLDARELAAAFPGTVPALAELGYDHAQELLDTKIETPEQVGRWTDSIFNSCVPMSRASHQGVLPPVPGEHHYPWPAKGADLIRYDDFQLWVTIEDGSHAAVVPAHARGSDNGDLQLLHARHGTRAATALAEAQRLGRRVIIPADSDIALTAFRRQIPPGSATASVPLATRAVRHARAAVERPS